MKDETKHGASGTFLRRERFHSPSQAFSQSRTRDTKSSVAATKPGGEDSAPRTTPSPGGRGRHPRLQILTMAELLAGKKIQFPEHRVETFAKAERKTRHQQEELF